MAKKRWIVVANKSRETFHSWQPTESCPTGTGYNALTSLRELVAQGYFLMAQRRLAPHVYKLLIMDTDKNEQKETIGSSDNSNNQRAG